MSPVSKISLKDRLQNELERTLNHAIPDRGNTQNRRNGHCINDLRDGHLLYG